MNPDEHIWIDPALLHLPGSRRDGADPLRLHNQYKRYGNSLTGMPPIEIKRGSDGKFVIYDGVTRATRAAKHRPGESIPAEVTGNLSCSVGHLPAVGEML